MPVAHLQVGVVAVKRRLTNPWIDHEWVPSAVLPGVPDTPPRTLIGREDESEIWYLGPETITLHSGETAHYRDNLTSARPSVWVALREDGEGLWRVAGVTVDPYEGEAYVDQIGDRVEALTMPSEIAAEMQAFFEIHHVEQTFFKRKRDRQDPDSLGTRGIGHPLNRRGGPGRGGAEGDGR
ncbi:DUF3305 domain-containing protein [Phreatobacter sp.]|uniref:DUF3305 domain-containing protein n=1 Tax=Phreatobacter sp. TaxID=1966341 RepID=UPI003F6FA01F